ncbi:MAG: hypothetical protein HY615_10450 [Candidatus Rokubacteria bacterium]|nr:hypothetical protein [Candidatus Rokubacteria bacterium]
MLSEEALILIVTAGAIGLLVLGVLELISPSRSRHPVRRRPPVPLRPPPPAPALAVGDPMEMPAPPRSHFASPPWATRPAPPPPPPPEPPPPVEVPAVEAPAAEAEPAPPPPSPPPRRRRSKVSPHARPHAGRRREADVGTGEASGQIAEPAATPPVAPDAPREPAAVEAVASPAGSSGPPTIDPLLVDTCFTLYQDGRYDEVLPLADEVLRRPRTERVSDEAAHSTAALWSVVGLAKQALGDDEGARYALEAALEIAPADERETYQQHVAALALSAAQTWFARATGSETDDRVGAIRTTLAWTERGLAAVPWDSRLRDLHERARRERGHACEQAALALVQRQEFGAARRLLREALDDPECPAARAEALREILAGTFGSEIGQLTAQAIRSMQEARESEALAALQRAEELLETVPAEALPPKRREEVDQRLWWGYTRLGTRRVESGEYEEALDPLIRALRYTDIGPDRQAETRSTLVRALEGVADVRSLAIRQLADGGQWDEAVLRAEELLELMRGCAELGLTEQDLFAMRAKTQRLCDELGMENRA